MRNQGQLFIGMLFILVGLMFLVGELLDVNVWAFCWPLGLIVLGVWLLLRPQLVSSDAAVRHKLLGDIRRAGSWQVANEEIWIGVGDVDLDMTHATVPPGETRLRFLGFVSSIDLLVPEGVGISVSSTAFVTDAKVLGQKRERFLAPLQVVSDDYETADRKVRLETTFLVVDLSVKQA